MVERNGGSKLVGGWVKKHGGCMDNIVALYDEMMARNWWAVG
jgi:hypothetical protein